MKRFLIIWCMSLLLMGCKDQGVDMLFDKLPEERMGERLQELQSKLLESSNGWKATLNTGTATAKSAYNFYIDFENNNRCKMVGDLTATTSSTWHESTYRLIWSMNASLVFDTFTYITMLQEPSSAYGGVAPHGYRSDIEFEYVRSTADSIFMKGKKYQHDLVLTKISADDVSVLDQGGLSTKIAEVVDFFVRNTNAYFTIGTDGVKYAVSLDRPAKTMTITWLDTDGKVNSVSSAYAYSLKGLDVFKPIIFNGGQISKIDFSNGVVKVVSSAGEYDVINNPSPILPITTLFASNGAYNTLLIEQSGLPLGITSEFNTVFNNHLAHWQFNNVIFVWMKFKLINSTTASLQAAFLHSNGTTYIAQGDYTYTYVGNKIKLSSTVVGNGNWTGGWVHSGVQSYFLGAEFTLDYVVSSNPNVVNIGGLYKTPTSFFYGKLAKE